MRPSRRHAEICDMKHAIIAWERTPTNVALARAADWLLLNPVRALKVLRPGDVALARLDVRRTLDGIEVGMEALGELSARGVTILNDPSVLLSTHDKLLTARLLDGAGIAHPETRLVTAVGSDTRVGRPGGPQASLRQLGPACGPLRQRRRVAPATRRDRGASLVPIRRSDRPESRASERLRPPARRRAATRRRRRSP